MNNLVQTGMFFLTLLLVLNVTIINLFVLRASSKAEEDSRVTISNDSGIADCDDNCQKTLEKDMRDPTPTRLVVNTPFYKEKATPKEFILPLGSGSTTSVDWKEIPGAEITIDTSNYPTINKVVFEVFLSIPTANGFTHAKLVNATDKRDVWFSEVTMETNTVTKREAVINLEEGKKTYKVMMKSTMGYEAVLHNARIIITTE